jgi:hypothetical protein
VTIATLKHAPALVEWWKRLACRQGVTLVFALALVHHPDINIPEIAAGFSTGAASVSESVIECILESVSPFSGMVEHVVDMEDFMPTVLIEEKEVNPPPSRDFESKMPFADAMAGRLFVAAHVPVEQNQDQEASSAMPPS